MNQRSAGARQSAFLILFFLTLFPFSLRASENQELKKQIQELNETVQKLTTLVEGQNKRIEELENKSKTTVPSSSPVLVEGVSKNKKNMPPVKEETASSVTTENQAREERSIGAWKYPVPSGGAWKLLPDISAIGVFSGAYFKDDPGPAGHDPSRTGFNLQEIELAIQSVIDPYIRADLFLSFHESGVELEEAYITTLSLPKGFQIKAGKYLIPFGRQNSKHLEQWPFVNNNLVNRYFLGDEGFNELGVEFSYLFPSPFFLQAQFSFNQGENQNNFDGSRKGDFAYTGRLVGSGDLTDHLTLLAGASAAFGFNASGIGNATNLFGGDLLLKWKPSKYEGIEWQTEYLFRRREVPGAIENEGGLSTYLLGNWSPRWGAGMRAEYLGIPSEFDKILRLSPMLSFRPTEFFRLKLQYDFTKTLGVDVNHSAILQMIFNMGPHGAHVF